MVATPWCRSSPPWSRGRPPGRTRRRRPARAGGAVPRRSRSRRVRIDVSTIFPSWFDVLDLSLTGRARESGLLDVAVHDLRDWTHDRHRTVDDTPYGGG